MLNSKKRQIEVLKNKVLCKILGIPISTRISNLYLESNIDSISVQWETIIAYQSEKCR